MGVVTRKRPRRLVVVAAVIALAAALFVAIQAPLQAQAERRITIKVNGENHFVTESQLEAAADRSPPFTQTNSRGDTVPYSFDRGTSLDALLRAARPRVPSATKVVDLTTDGGATIHADRDANIIFFNDKTHRRFAWIKNRGSTSDRQIKSDRTVLIGRRGNLLDVDIEADPENPRVDEEVTFTADVRDGLEGEEFTKYSWDFGDEQSTTTREDTVTHAYDARKAYTVTLTVQGDKESVGSDSFTFRARKKAKPPKSSDGSGGSSGGSGGSSGGSGGSGGSTIPPDSSGSGALPPAGTTPPPTTPALPPPSSSPPSDPGRGPNLDPNAPPTEDIPTGQEVSGILVSTSTPPRPGQAGAKAPNANAKNAKAKNDEFDWKLAGGIALTALLVILGAVRERGRLHRLLPQRPAPPQPQPQSG